MDADVSKTDDADADGEVVWSWRAHAGAKFAFDAFSHHADDGGNKLVHRGEREVSRKPLRRECRVVSAEPVGQRALLRKSFARWPWVQPAPDIPCALFDSRAATEQNPGAISAAGMRSHVLRHCEERGDEAIQTISAEAVWIASLALAMTEDP